MTHVDVVVVSYNSADRLRACVEPLAALDGVRVIVADNASTDGSLDSLAGLPVSTIPLAANGGFAVGCNTGWRAGNAPLVLFLNPDARIDAGSLGTLARVLEEDAGAGAAAPRIVHADGSLDFSLRRFPRLPSTYARALFLQRVFPRSLWTDEVVRRREVYERRGSPEWASGACLLVRRSALEELGGFDEGFFLYCEDKDLCKRLWDAGYTVGYEPQASCVHEGGASAPRASLLPVLAASRLRYARKHRSTPAALGERLGIGLEALTHMVVTQGGAAARAGHARALALVASRSTDTSHPARQA